MPVMTSGGVEVHYEWRGAGPPLLLCSGSGSSIDGSEQLVAFLARSFDVVAFDYRGLGRSHREPAAYTMADCAADALAVLDALGRTTTRVMGISFGGMVAQEIAVRVPDRIDRLALVCTSPGGAGGSSYPLHELSDLPPAERARRSAAISDTRPRAVSGEGAAGAVEGRAQTAGERAQLAARAGHDVWDRLPAINCPTFVASGRYDGIAPPENGEAIASRIAGATFRVYEGGHLFVLQDRAAWPDILTFLSAP